jgi:hypothetical protein
LYVTPEIKRFRGLHLQRNSFEVPDGALEEAENCVLYSDQIIEKCRGYYKFFDNNTPPATVKGLCNFQETLVSSNTDGLYYYQEQGEEPNKTGVSTPIPNDPAVIYDVSGVESRFAQANGNLYTTTDNGVVKLSNINSVVLQSGVPQGLDITAYYKVGSASSLLQPESSPNPDVSTNPLTDFNTFQVSYRVVFGYKDLNSNLLLSAPSSPVTINNPVVSAAVANPAGTIARITSTAHGLVVGMNIYVFYGRTTEPGGTGCVYFNSITREYPVIAVTANTFDIDLGVPYPSDPGPPVAPMAFLNYCYAASPEVEFSIPTECDENILQPTFSVNWIYKVYRTLPQVSGQFLGEFISVGEGVIPIPQPSPRILFYTDDKLTTGGEYLYTNSNSGEGELQANYRPPLPQDLDFFQGSMFYANYQTRRLLNFSVVSGPNMTIGVPNNVYSFYDIDVDDQRRRFLAVTGIGNHTTLATCSDDGAGNLLITSPAHGFVSYGLISVYISDAYGNGDVITSETYYVTYVSADTFLLSATIADKVAGVPVYIPYKTESSLYVQAIQFPRGNFTLCNWSRDAGGDVTVTLSDNNLFDGMWVYISNSTGAIPIVAGLYQVIVAPGFPNEFYFNDGLGADTGTCTVSDEPYCFAAKGADALGRTQTAQNLVKALNRDPDDFVYAQYLSLTDDLGDMLIQTKGFDDIIRIYASDARIADGIYPQIPFVSVSNVAASEAALLVTVVSPLHNLRDHQNVFVYGATQIGGAATTGVDGLWSITVVDVNTFTFTIPAPPGGGTLQQLSYSYTRDTDYIESINDDAPNGLLISKNGEPEAVPLVNFVYVGDKSPIRRIHALSNALIILKDDGVYRLTGDNVANFSINLLDSTVRIIATDSSAVLNNQVLLLSNQGVAMTTETSVEIISRPIDDVIQSILTKPEVQSVTHAFSNEVDRLYLISTTTPDYVQQIPDKPSVMYVYNTMTDSWTSWEWLFTHGTIGPSNKVYLLDSETGNIKKERKNNKRTDYMGQNYNLQVLSIDDSSVYATCKIVDIVPESGDCIVKQSVVNIIDEVIQIDATTYVLVFFDPSNLVGGQTEVGYSRTTNVVDVLAPDHGLQPGDFIYVYYATGGNPPALSSYQVTFADANSFTFTSVGLDDSGLLSYSEYVTAYEGYTLRAKFSPFHAGMVGRSKQFCQFQCHFRSPDCTAAMVTFSGDTYPTSLPVYWERILTTPGWGLFPWGLVPWGQPIDDNLPVGTQPASILRTYVPATSARGTFIQPTIENKVAGDRVSIQSLSYDVRAYGSRPSK